ncbi:mRNA interferase HigB [Singulisphaera sp. GP187]|uniref:type II toxin-antitoxin system HigB family toxin n=1 Tax=Singulisphaera sp. GP187 TaxID=1882752 RepID=UPI00092A5EC8|nr:type II toxin-antitoxin system HigB family toxin [Singulisphaera sp. GP187]SIN87793.1 mRNA interferase HigB [Singulisphaera sp. GP187]
MPDEKDLLETHRNHLISRKMVHKFVESHPGTERDLESLLDWCRTVEKSDWRTFADVRATYSHADQVGEMVYFNVCGNKYRFLTWVNYRPNTAAKVLLRAVLTHKEYDKLSLK